MFFVTLCIILIGGSLTYLLFNKIKLPGLIGYIAIGIVFGPYVLNIFDNGILSISSELRSAALILILVRAGLTLSLDDLKKIGLPAILMCFVPAIFEMCAIGLLGPLFFGISYLDSFILGAVLGAVSPAVVVPRMVKLIDEKRGTNKSIPQLIMAGSSLDDVVVIVIFTALTTLAKGEELNVMTFVNVPLSIVLGIGLGLLSGFILSLIFKKIHIRDTLKIILILGLCFGFYGIEKLLEPYFGFSGLLASMSLGIIILMRLPLVAERISVRCSKMWIMAEIVLFTLLGASININYFANNFGLGLALILCGLAIRSVGVIICLIKSKLNFKERLYVVIAYLPKATVQAAIGGLPLAMGLGSGELILSVAVISILISAPLGAYLMDLTGSRLLTKQETFIAEAKNVTQEK
jgi:NhaP-type Na+/H+ or K+/H+ antiporter